MNNEQQNANSLEALLNHQLNQVNQLKSLLAEELEAVKNRDGKELVNVAQQKEVLLTAITSVDQQISNHPNVDQITDNGQYAELKATINNNLEECQTQNEVVYLAAKQSEVVIEQVKNLLIGGSKNTTYDAYGQKKSGPSLTKGIKA